LSEYSELLGVVGERRVDRVLVTTLRCVHELKAVHRIPCGFWEIVVRQ